MRFNSISRSSSLLLAVVLFSPSYGVAAELPSDPAASSSATQPALAAASEYRQKLEEYIAAQRKYEDETEEYWNAIADKRRGRNTKRRNGQEVLIDDYVLVQPPVYSGPSKPVDPSAPPQEGTPSLGKYVPVVADFLQSAEGEFHFVPQRPQSEIEYKRAYAKVASTAGLSKEQAVRIYGFESGGDGNYDVQAGLEQPGPDAQAISTALGYNQLLATNSVELLAEQGDKFVEILQAKARGLNGEAAAALRRKISVLKTMIDFSRSVPDDWNEHEKLANTPKGLGIHALNLDLDVGPLLQTQKLLDSVVFARTRGYAAVLTAAELEMMNLTGDGNGGDIVMMPSEWRGQVPTSNFFQRGGYERNPIVSRNNVVSKLMTATDAVMDREIELNGAKDLASLFSN
jgi:hypothetical protein